jgi:uncharacterized membrane protein
MTTSQINICTRIAASEGVPFEVVAARFMSNLQTERTKEEQRQAARSSRARVAAKARWAQGERSEEV